MFWPIIGQDSAQVSAEKNARKGMLDVFLKA